MKLRVWFNKLKTVKYFTNAELISNNQFRARLENDKEIKDWDLAVDDHIMHSTDLLEKLPSGESGQTIYEEDVVKSRFIQERLNCGGLNTPENIGVVVFKDGEWLIKIKVEKDLEYLDSKFFYTRLDDPYSYREVIGNIYESRLEDLTDKHKTKM